MAAFWREADVEIEGDADAQLAVRYALWSTRIAAPDNALLRAVMVKLFADRQVAVDEQLVSYVLSRTERSLGRAM